MDNQTTVALGSELAARIKAANEWLRWSDDGAVSAVVTDGRGAYAAVSKTIGLYILADSEELAQQWSDWLAEKYLADTLLRVDR